MSLITRRTFLMSVLAASAVSPPVHSSFSPVDIPRYFPDDMFALIKEIIGPVESIIKIGQTISETRPKLAVSLWSVEFVCQVFDTHSPPEPGRVHRLKNRYRKKITSDFENGRTTLINGWMLSTTEVELCLAMTGKLRKLAQIPL